MLSPKKGLLCNLNHIHLQHVSLGLHLSRHPELQETSASMGGGDQTGCSDCPENCEQVDANSNNPSLKCRCCESHTQQPVTLGLQKQTAQEGFPYLHAEEDVASPCDPPCDLASSSSSSSSSVSSCSDFSLDDSPVSVYCKGFSREESRSPENQPNVILPGDTQSLSDQGRTCDGRDANLNPTALQRSDTLARESPDSLCSSTLIDSQCDETSPSAVPQETTSVCTDLDPNCNSLPNPDAVPPAPPAPGRIKQLELWISHLQKSPGVISVLYSPTAFFALSQGPLPHLADELLLLIQPLSVLTFHLDLLFEHHHLSMDVRPLSRRLESPLSPAHRSAQAVQPSLEGQSGTAGDSLEDEFPPDALGRVAGADGSTRSQSQAAVPGLVPGSEVGAALQQTFQHVLRWGDQLSRTFLGADSSLETPRPEAGPQDAGTGLSGWWGQLSQASRIYAAPSKEKFPFLWWTKLRTAAGDSSASQAARPQPSMNEPRGTELQLLQTKAVPELPGPKPSSHADTSGTSSPEDLIVPAGAGAPTKPVNPAAGENLLAVPPEPCVNRNRTAPSDPEAGGPPGPEKGSWLGRLFGATSPSARSSSPSPDAISARSRRPSSWLSPSARVLAVVVKGLAAEKTHAEEQPQKNSPEPPQAPR
ncbi:run and sh3 domain-containing protein 1 [Limosa lapponica baueri]|uniref:Run and sh3 domain-containing protein 1 n=1 Tax=Limosa lapponica baueri TaxID=1758121 RepID=A0A2I0T8B6_LIMLA|nr:run and sh3 domain-containing protein 1 [Limosa lapponica baueri]